MCVLARVPSALPVATSVATSVATLQAVISIKARAAVLGYGTPRDTMRRRHAPRLLVNQADSTGCRLHFIVRRKAEESPSLKSRFGLTAGAAKDGPPIHGRSCLKGRRAAGECGGASLHETAQRV